VVNPSDRDKDQFFYPRAKYRGEFTPEHLAFNANLQEFETAGKIPPEKTYKEIKKMWKALKASKRHLLTDEPDVGEEG
jgi:hypothetical protein